MLLEPSTARKILIVDDDALMRRSIVRLVGTETFEVHDVGDDAEAIDALEHETYDLAIIDVVLPGMTGPELAEVLRQVSPGMPVIFISGYDQGRVEQKGVEPTDNFLQKPFSRDDLHECMRRALREVGAQ